jgi:hypothetical protein
LCLPTPKVLYLLYFTSTPNAATDLAS